MAAQTSIFHALRSLLDRVVDPLRRDETITHFTLAVPEAQTTTHGGVHGVQRRPPVVLGCPGCGAEIHQRRAIDSIDCPNCWREYAEDEFDDLELISMRCPRCDAEMNHGRRHPHVFDRPEWATCPECWYHWDLDHWF